MVAGARCTLKAKQKAARHLSPRRANSSPYAKPGYKYQRWLGKITRNNATGHRPGIVSSTYWQQAYGRGGKSGKTVVLANLFYSAAACIRGALPFHTLLALEKCRNE
jgi:hypothetical protein